MLQSIRLYVSLLHILIVSLCYSIGCDGEIHQCLTYNSQSLRDSTRPGEDTSDRYEKKEQLMPLFMPDTSVNNRLFLERSVVQEIGNVMPYVDVSKDLPDICYLNELKDQYLKLVFYPGNIANHFSLFEIGYTTEKFSENHRYLQSTYDIFKTESNIQLGMNKEDVVNIKGKAFHSSREGKLERIVYRLDNYHSSSFLQRYNMPVYYAEFFFRGNKLIRYVFGFEYP